MSENRVVDVLIVGSGPVGSTFARCIRDALPDASVLMVEAGPRLTSRAGENIRNRSPEDRAHLVAELRRLVSYPASEGAVEPRPGTFLVADGGRAVDPHDGMPAAAMAANVGGMGSHWTCACPRPSGRERVPMIAGSVLDEALTRAESLLGVTQSGFAENDTTRSVAQVLAEVYETGHDGARPVQPMPLACAAQSAGLPRWAGADAILDDLADGSRPNFELRDSTVCTKLVRDGARVTGAVLSDVRTGDSTGVSASFVVVACDALRTPQLLWASGIRPPALGHYLNDQPQIISFLELDPSRLPLKDSRAEFVTSDDTRDHLTGALWIPLVDDRRPMHGQVMQMEASPVPVPGGAQPANRHLVSLGWFLPKDVRFEDCVSFAGDELDAWGLPRIRISYDLTEQDRRLVELAIKEMHRGASALGDYIEDGTPSLLPSGSSLHYQGTTRMGGTDDGESVVDTRSRVWGLDNLYLGGNGVIPTATACNPTLTSVALATLASDDLVGRLARLRAAARN
ncbi:GMC oxidoreductase [Amycolatopsis acidicola]|uniref:GMC oxidoreductase n=1 Tax=Amycolatopsis acidicola TaxID=2596893 RepID=UPI00140D439B|nr:GMC oxidoreductase [Amycolatopsis acidicola]